MFGLFQHGVTPDSTVVVPGCSHALVYGFRGDNSGPPSVKEVLSDYAAMRKLFPNAKQVSLSAFQFRYVYIGLDLYTCILLAMGEG